MNRVECEAKILEKLKEIKKIYKEYNPNGTHLSLAVVNDCYMFHNSYWDDDFNTPINYTKIEEDAE